MAGTAVRLTTRCLTVCLLLLPAVHVTSAVASDRRPLSRDSHRPSPCCLPYRFQAVIASLQSFSVQARQVTRLYRNWEARIQVHEQATFTETGIEQTLFRLILDYKNGKQYMIQAGTCETSPITSGMLEPCMPADSTYLGNSYLGLFANQANFDAWYFRRTDQNRNIEMTIMVTKDNCVPIMEHIAGTMGGAPVDNLVLFTNVTENVNNSEFEIPYVCLGANPM
ncbi:uncharacterized protein LOC131932272 [Physella acuta]|uniref:uncharacterized protein LOC131932272 n=1 Tax=Physella acuta TaxID=109671 RepID=UPI0027DD9F56|nr:uncharacterized protein LOC131932272 [Physella acuta]